MAIRGYAPSSTEQRGARDVLGRFFKFSLATVLALNLAACLGNSASSPPPSALDGLSDPLSATHDLAPKYVASTSQNAAYGQRPAGVVSVGDDLFVSDPLPRGRLYSADAGQDVTLNLVDVDIAAAAKTIITDILGQNLIVDDKIAGTITLQTIRPVSRGMLVDLFESVLSTKGYALIRNRDTYRIAEGGTAGGRSGSVIGGLPINVGGRGMEAGLSAQVIPLRYISAEDMRDLLATIAPKEAVLSADASRNFIIVSGTRAQVTSILEAVNLFDVDWMRGMSAAIFPLKSSNPGAIAEELEQLFGSTGGPLRGTIKFVPNTHLNAVLVITSRAEYLRRARELIRRLEDMAVQSETQYFVYKVQNRSAKELADVLKSMLGQQGGSSASTAGLSPKLTSSTTSSPGADKSGDPSLTSASTGDSKFGSAPPGDTTQGQQASDPSSQLDKAANVTGSLASSKEAAVGDLGSPAGGGNGGGSPGLANLSITADDENNSIIITGTRLQYEKVLRILSALDSAPIQVLLEAVIAEVTLTDDLKFGVRWFLTQHHYKLSEADDATTSNASTILSGLNFSAKLGAIDSLLNTLSSITNVKVVSTPSLTVLDNHAAHLQVGDEVPIVTQTSTSTASSTAATVTNVEYKNTGVILSVTPRVNQNGLVLLDIDQEVSGVTNTTTSNINSPTVQQRKVSTTVIVQDGQTLVLGGLVQDQKNDTRTRMPLIGRVPVVGSLFGTTDNSKARTELIVFVRPRVLRNTTEARQVTDEFRTQLGHLFQAQKKNQWREDVGNDLDRITH